MFLAGNVRHLRPATGGDENVLGAEALAVHLDAVRIEQTGVTFEQGHPAVHQQVAVDPVEPLDLAVLVADQGRPVELRLAGAPAIGPGLLEVLAEMRAIDQQLLRHAADVDAGATQVATLRHRDTGTEAGGEAGGAYAPEPAPMTNRSKSKDMFLLLDQMRSSITHSPASAPAGSTQKPVETAQRRAWQAMGYACPWR